LLLLAEKYLPGRPAALFVVAASIVVLSLTSLGEQGFSVVGALPQGLPEFQFPALRARDVDGVVPLAFACLLLSYVESVSAARALADAHRTRIDPRQEFLGLGAANLGAALFQAYPVAGGLSQSSVNDKAGARTPLALVFASLTIGLCLVFLTGMLKNLPTVVLAAIVLVAVKGLVNIGEMKRLWRVSRYEFFISVIAFAAVLFLGILKGVIFAVLASLAVLLRRTAHPHVATLGRIPGTRKFSDIERNPDNERVPGALVFRVDAAMLYFNVDHVREAVWQMLRAASGPLRLVVCDLSTSPQVDTAGVKMLAKLHQELAEAGISFRLVAAHAVVRDILRAEELEESVGYFGRRISVADVIDEFEGRVMPGEAIGPSPAEAAVPAA
jgi:MFS superfamily sulfate permease-like transporter